MENEEETIVTAENLIGKLEGEHKRWSGQVGELAEALEQLPKRAILASGFITYLSHASEDERQQKLADWLQCVNLESFNLKQFLST